jgi:hypothetical protein
MARKPFDFEQEPKDTTYNPEVVETIPEPEVEVAPEPVVVVKKAPEPPKTKTYICNTRTWLSTQARMVNRGDRVVFEEGQPVPKDFEEVK